MNDERARGVGPVAHGSSDDPELLDFSANTNPRTPPGVADAYEDALDQAGSYPPEPPNEYRGTAAEYVDVTPESIVPTPGGLAAIRLAIALAVDPGDSALVPAPSFGEYAREIRLQGGTPTFVSPGAIVESDPTDHALAVVCNPNNPTGEAIAQGELRAFARRCRESDTRLLIDEAFLGYTDRPSMAGTDGVVVARSLTKLFGLPGIRAGFAVATGEFGEAMRNARRPWNLGAPALAVGSHCMRQRAFVEETRERVARERERMREALATRFDVRESEGPFLLLDVGDRPVGRFVAAVRERGVAIRDATTFRGLDSHVRVAVREPEANDRLLEVLRDV
ncbi:aminotransferase class I/II-fold pyridoxal phosphate-dependent enzyme [Halapricum desulfuricans]|uniref:Aminotransferase n=1 Tax=Halapricum desulfuricans TaxID=2841257 RepID=A0A897N2V5_9EURY|nr:aminotransferase class I/II-fold pyridoxal phosphate-dependent enzyme [Halapricum desulfuricans]QSG06821.1 Histidinol-phosphate/aromatic aminotransferase or cobyric acid decarboxylase [Halapricum desulfuricans]